jgi:ABC-type Fe3+/spermidine/putrescine transport system ATPase subunit
VTAFLQLEGIEKQFGAFTALRSIDLDVQAGEFVCFLGPSGCGKTTLLRIVAGLEAQSAGRILQAGRDISTLPPSQRDYGIVFQSYALFPNLSVADNVAYGLVNRRTPKAKANARVAELLQLVGLPGSQDKFPAQLSGGQQQRIALARALATSPGLLLLDEPLSALDAIVRVHLRQEIRSLQRQRGVTISSIAEITFLNVSEDSLISRLSYKAGASCGVLFGGIQRKPSGVTLDGKPLSTESWTYDAEKDRVVLKVTFGQKLCELRMQY